MSENSKVLALAAGVGLRHWIRPSEWLLLAYFTYVAAAAVAHRLPANHRLACSLIPLALATLAAIESRFTRRWSDIARDWAPPALVLLAYWQLQWFSARPDEHLQNTWIAWDRMLFDRFSLRSVIESSGAVVPGLLELCYLCLYAFPPACIAAIYICGKRRNLDRFFFTMLMGTLSAYALLPHFPSVSPRIAFPNEHLPEVITLFRSINVWVLDHLDISTSVFPSGHVAVAFSAAFGTLRTLPGRRRIHAAAFAFATMVFIATVYGRYHYAVDGLASIMLSAAAWCICEVYDQIA